MNFLSDWPQEIARLPHRLQSISRDTGRFARGELRQPPLRLLRQVDQVMPFVPRRFLKIARDSLSPNDSLVRYYLKLRNTYRTWCFYRRRRRRGEVLYRDAEISWSGLDRLRKTLDGGRPPLLITWHNGIFGRIDALNQGLPELKLTRRNVILHEHPKIGMLAVAGSLQRGAPALIHFDGKVGNLEVAHRVLDVNMRFATGFLHVSRLFGAPILPVSTGYRGRRHCRVHFGAPLFEPGELEHTDNAVAIARVVGYFLSELRRMGGEQLSLGWVRNRLAYFSH